MTMERFSLPQVPPMPDKVPTAITQEPWFCGGQAGRKAMFLMTDVGVVELSAAAKLCGIHRNTLYSRLVARKNAWKDADILSKRRKKQKRKSFKVATKPTFKKYKEPSEAPANFKKQTHGAVERRLWGKEKDKMEQIRATLPARDQEYRDALKHHRAVCG